MPRSYGDAATPEAVHQMHRRGHGGLPSKQARWGSRPAVVAGPLTLKDLWRSKSNTQQEREQQRRNREIEKEGRFTRTHVATECQASQWAPGTVKGIFPENACKTSTLSQADASVRCQTEHLPTLTLGVWIGWAAPQILHCGEEPLFSKE